MTVPDPDIDLYLPVPPMNSKVPEPLLPIAPEPLYFVKAVSPLAKRNLHIPLSSLNLP